MSNTANEATTPTKNGTIPRPSKMKPQVKDDPLLEIPEHLLQKTIPCELPGEVTVPVSVSLLLQSRQFKRMWRVC